MGSSRKKSKKRSDTNSNSPPLHSHVFFADRNLGSRIFPAILRQAGIKIEIHADHFTDTEPDKSWLKEAGKRQWVVLTTDKAIQRRKHEIQSLMTGSGRMFVFSAKLRTAEQQAQAFLKATSKINNILSKNPGPLIVRIYKDGAIRVTYNDKKKKSRSNRG